MDRLYKLNTRPNWAKLKVTSFKLSADPIPRTKLDEMMSLGPFKHAPFYKEKNRMSLKVPVSRPSPPVLLFTLKLCKSIY